MSLDVAFAIHGPGGWIELDDEAAGYETHKDARSEQAVTWRRQNIDSAYVEGTYTNEAVRENVTESVVIRVFGANQWEFSQRLEALTDALSQLQYDFRMQVGNLRETWKCSVADYTVQTPQEMLHASMGIVRAQIPRLPAVVREEVVI